MPAQPDIGESAPTQSSPDDDHAHAKDRTHSSGRSGANWQVHHHRDVSGGAARAAVFGISDGLVSNTANKQEQCSCFYRDESSRWTNRERCSRVTGRSDP